MDDENPIQIRRRDAPAPPVQEVEVVTPDSFNWGDVGTGAGTAAGLVLLAAATGLGHRRRVASS